MGPTSLQNAAGVAPRANAGTATPPGAGADPAPARTLTVTPQAGAPASGAVRAWAVGQVLPATVVSAGGAGAASVLQVDGEALRAQTRLALQDGQRLTLEVTRAGPPAVLKVLDPAAADDLDALAVRLLRASLPLQRPMGESLGVLQRLMEQPLSRRSGDLPEAARALLSDLMASLPRPRDAGDGARLAAMFRASGLFFEAEQARTEPRSDTAARTPGQGAQGSDFKARVAAVADALRQAVQAGTQQGPAEEADDALRAVLARIETNQAVSARGSQEQAALWRTDLPFADERGTQAATLTVRREAARDETGAVRDGAMDWVVELDLQPPGHGPLHARVSLASGVVSTLFTTEDPQLLAGLETHAGELERRLEGEDLAVGGVRWRRGRAPEEAPAGGVDRLVDRKA